MRLALQEVIVKLADLLSPSKVAVMVAVALAALVAMVKVVEVAPGGTVTVLGAVASALFDASEITSPLLPAGLLRVTVAVALDPPSTEAGRVSKATRAALMVRFWRSVVEPNVAVRVTATSAERGIVPTVVRADVAPAATVAKPGTVTTDGALTASATGVPDVPAGPLSVTVAPIVVPPKIASWPKEKASRVAGVIFRATVLERLAEVAVISKVVVAFTPCEVN
jgi:hypothetical protein